MCNLSLFYFFALIFFSYCELILSLVKAWLEVWFSGRVQSPALLPTTTRGQIKLFSIVTIMCGLSDVVRTWEGIKGWGPVPVPERSLWATSNLPHGRQASVNLPNQLRDQLIRLSAAEKSNVYFIGQETETQEVSVTLPATQLESDVATFESGTSDFNLQTQQPFQVYPVGRYLGVPSSTQSATTLPECCGSCNPSTEKTEAGGLPEVQGQPGL